MNVKLKILATLRERERERAVFRKRKRKCPSNV